MGKAFTAYTYDDAANLLKAKVVPKQGIRDFPLGLNQRRTPTAQAATKFFNGDHWQNSAGFIGQLPPSNLLGSALILADIKAGFVSENIIQEVVETHIGGILGREPMWSLLKAEGETNRADKASFENVTGETLTQWWNERKGLKDLQKAITTALLESIAVRRLFFPVGLVPAGSTLNAANLADALKFIFFETVTCDVAGVFTDPDTQADIGIFLYEEHDAKGDVTNHAAELSFLNENGDTVMRVVRDRGATTESGPYKLGGRLLVYQIDRRALITEQVQSNQRALNLAHTMMMRNVNMAGARERTVTNAQPPITAKKVDVETGAVKTFPGTYKTGAGAVNFVMGVPIHDEAGNVVGYTNPNVNIADPSPVTTFVETADNYRLAIYSQCHQRHVLIVDKADTSGKAREVARKEYERSLKETKTVMDANGRWQLETVLRLAAQISNQPEKYAGLRADFNCLIDAGEPDPDKQLAVMQLRQPGGPKNEPLISDETARNWIGVEDAAAELAKVEQEAKRPSSNPSATQPVPGQQIPNQPEQVPRVQ
jgi:hypothetical protein